MKKLTTLFVLSFFLNAGLFGQQFQSSYENVNEIQLTTGSADCEIISSGTSLVEVELYHKLGDGYEPDVDFRNNKLIMKDNKYRGNADMRWVLKVPENIEIKYTAGSGDLNVSNVQVDLISISGSGDIELINSGGNFKSNTGSGNIKLDNFDGEISANTGSGDISALTFKGSASLNTGSGSVEMNDVQAAVKANTGSGDIEISDLASTGDCAFNAGSGSVEIGLAQTPRFNLSLNSGSGDAILKRNGNALNANIVMRANKANGEIVAPFGFDREEEEGEGRQTVVKKYAAVGSGTRIDIKIGTGSGKAVIR